MGLAARLKHVFGVVTCIFLTTGIVQTVRQQVLTQPLLGGFLLEEFFGRRQSGSTGQPTPLPAASAIAANALATAAVAAPGGSSAAVLPAVRVADDHPRLAEVHVGRRDGEAAASAWQPPPPTALQVHSVTLPENAPAGCADMRQFRFEQSGRVLSWTVNEPKEEERFPLWAADVGNWSMTAEVTEFLNAFLARQFHIFCETAQDELKVMIIRRDNGLGNSLMGSMSYLVMAAIMGWAVVLVGWFDGLKTVFDTPLAEYSDDRLRKLKVLPADVMKGLACRKETDELGCYGISGDDQWMWCDDYNEHFKNKRLNHVVGCCTNFLPLIMRNMHVGKRLRAIFGDGEVATPLFRALFRPSLREVLKPTEKYRHERYVAAQVRSFNAADDGHLFAAMAGCLSMLLHRAEFIGSRLFVAAISKDLLKKMGKVLGMDVMHNPPPGGENHRTLDWIIGMRDVWTMVLSDALVTSPWSSFGSLAAAYSGKAAWEVEGAMNGVTGRCRRMITAEPCCMRNWGPLRGTCPAPKKSMKIPKTQDRPCGFDDGMAGLMKWRGVEASFETDFARKTQSSTDSCDSLQQCRFEVDGSLMCWYKGESAKAVFGPWPQYENRDQWVPKEATVKFLNAFLEKQRKVFCETPFEKQEILFIKRLHADNNFAHNLQGAISYVLMAALVGRAVVFAGFEEVFSGAFDTPLRAYTEESLSAMGLLSPEAVDAANCRKGKSDQVDCHYISGDDKWMWCEKIEDHFPKRLTQIFGCCTSYIQLLLRNPNYAGRLRGIFGSDEVSTSLYRLLLRPSQKAVVSSYDRAPGQKVIAAHLKMLAMDGAREQQLLDASAACLIAMLEQPGFEESQIYIDTDRSSLVQKLQERLSRQLLHSSYGAAGALSKQYFVVLMQDIWPLVRADALLLTPWSPAGTTAAALNGVVPWELEGSTEQLTGRCRKVVSAEPCCMRGWPPDPSQGCAAAGTDAAPSVLSEKLDRRCGFDHGQAGAATWQGVEVMKSES
eukprot:TRINITY_DN51626_c0_g1_i2.p1 TRINITY_DN51626_c0_g1~~TRINITY_DN51626_c0_g1_i2.p1  ORF type:complete len:1000 (+),score=206.88 TRINITY_DN51626_c0_g1_i2:116-3115(+)